MLLVVAPIIGAALGSALYNNTDVEHRLSQVRALIFGAVGGTAGGFLSINIGDWPLVAVTVGGLAAAGSAVYLAAYWDERVRDPMRARSNRDPEAKFSYKAKEWARGHSPSIRGLNIAGLGIGIGERASRVRLPGLSAEMSYYGLISVPPLLTAFGASMGYLERIVGAQQTEEIEAALVSFVSSIFAQDLATDVLEPLIEGLLSEERTGFAISSLVVVLWLGSRIFRAAVRALDEAYNVPTRHGFGAQLFLGVIFVVALVVTVAVVLTLVVVGPLFGDGQEIADRLGLGGAFAWLWSYLRWPAAMLACVAFLATLYRFGPNSRTTWRGSLPGAGVGTLCLIAVAFGFSLYVQFTGATLDGFDSEEDTSVLLAAQVIGLVLAVALFLWLCSGAIILGGLFNAELQQAARDGSKVEVISQTNQRSVTNDVDTD